MGEGGREGGSKEGREGENPGPYAFQGAVSLAPLAFPSAHQIRDQGGGEVSSSISHQALLTCDVVVLFYRRGSGFLIRKQINKTCVGAGTLSLTMSLTSGCSIRQKQALTERHPCMLVRLLRPRGLFPLLASLNLFTWQGHAPYHGDMMTISFQCMCLHMCRYV